HASLGAIVGSRLEDVGLGKIVITQILEESDVYRRGLDQEDEILSFMGRTITSVNQYKNVLGVAPRGWRVPLEFRGERDGKKVLKEPLARLRGVQRKKTPNPMPRGGGDPKQPAQPGQQPIIAAPAQPVATGPAAKYFEAKPGFVNYYFNRQERDRLL